MKRRNENRHPCLRVAADSCRRHSSGEQDCPQPGGRPQGCCDHRERRPVCASTAMELLLSYLSLYPESIRRWSTTPLSYVSHSIPYSISEVWAIISGLFRTDGKFIAISIEEFHPLGSSANVSGNWLGGEMMCSDSSWTYRAVLREANDIQRRA